ncbi:MAG TPA: nitronate monooxygenase [Longimicrobiales bacterium]|nr:nitronate monooxygenase [Longimicrobiales bacterium]
MSASAALPLVIQGGMGIAVSNWELARSVSSLGQLGVVSGTAVDSVLVRRLQDGDPGGHVRSALEHFPWPAVAAEVMRKYFVEGGKPADKPYALLSMYRGAVNRARHEVTILANFVEVWLAKQEHNNAVGINLLTKVQMPNLASLYGAMLAGVDYVLMGAGIPKEIPGVLDRLAVHEPATMRLDVDGGGPAEYLELDPQMFWEGPPVELRRPKFFPIISQASLGQMLMRKSTGRVDGFIVEGPTAGGHNAPPRGQVVHNERHEPQYTERDLVNMEQMRALGMPFYLAGGAASPESLQEALDGGASGVQVGTLFAYAAESGLAEDLKAEVLQRVIRNEVDVLTDGRASPTGFPFKVVQIETTNSARKQYEARKRVCDLGYLRTAYRRPDGRLDYRCAAEPVDTYVKKGGDVENTVGRKCLCNALMADIGMAQVRDGGELERPIITSGDDVMRLNRFLNDRTSYSARDVVEYLLDGVVVPERASVGEAQARVMTGAAVD